jgi:hypothetical protein
VVAVDECVRQCDQSALVQLVCQEERVRKVLKLRRIGQAEPARLAKRLESMPINGKLIKPLNPEEDPQGGVHGLQGAFRGRESIPERGDCRIEGEGEEIIGEAAAGGGGEVVGECE